ncbi:MAG: RnfABCDGE type electron transport complex subunit C, partial [Tidjanibacter sp.]|nr:RnfABCDGE type electron transport complex subunit C [Tidjanibacter sp.]
MKTFPIGGIHPSDCKEYSKGAQIERFPVPATVTIPLSQHIGAPAVACVAKGDGVKVGQVIATAGGFVSSTIHSSVSGVVTAVEPRADAQGNLKPAVVIAVEGDEWVEGVDLTPEVVKNINLSPSEIIGKVSEMGIVGMGGATFPTHVKLSIPAGKKAECLIINAVECEPYLTADYRVMLEQGERLLVGARILAKAIGVDKIYIGVENNKPDAIAHLEKLAGAYLEIEIVPLKMRYPQGGEKQLIAAVTGREVPSGALHIDVGAVVKTVGTALAV